MDQSFCPMNSTKKYPKSTSTNFEAIKSILLPRNAEGKGKWWDKTCHDRKPQLKKRLRRCKRGELEVEEYRNERKNLESG